MEVSKPIMIYCDNLSNIQLAKKPVLNARTKHIEVVSGEVDLLYVPTDRQITDIFTNSRSRQVAAIFEYAWLAATRHAKLEGEK